jgi:GntR family transcriptional regulator / MocR family aminotransferase
MRTAVVVKSLMDNGLAWLEQAALAQFLRDGSFDTHLRRLRQAHEARRNALVGALRSRLAGALVTGTAAGTHVLVRLPDDAPDAATLQQSARALGVGVYPLADSPVWFHEQLPGHERCLMLGYAHLTEAQIGHGIARLGQAVADG